MKTNIYRVHQDANSKRVNRRVWQNMAEFGMTRSSTVISSALHLEFQVMPLCKDAKGQGNLKLFFRSEMASSLRHWDFNVNASGFMLAI